MNCLLILCLSGLYVEGGAGVTDVHRSDIQMNVIGLVHNRPMYSLNGLRPLDYNQAANPMGRIAIGHEWNPSSIVRVDLQVRHESWIGTKKDRGTNSAWVSVRLMPWRE